MFLVMSDVVADEENEISDKLKISCCRGHYLLKLPSNSAKTYMKQPR